MKLGGDIALIQRFRTAQAGVFSTADLKNLLGEKHPAGFVRRVRALEREHLIERFVRGWYVTPGSFDLSTLSQRIAPGSYVSYGTVLADALVVGPAPQREVWSSKVGRSRIYRGADCRILHLGIDEQLLFGFEERGAVRWATPEKALLDTLYFYLRGRRYPFDIYSDLNLEPINRRRLRDDLRRYRNPKFAVFVNRVLDGSL
jgi:hypothetical protein